MKHIMKTKRTERIEAMLTDFLASVPQLEAERAVLLTESYQKTEDMPTVMRRATAFSHILAHLPIVIREKELIVGSNTIHSRSSQVFPEFSCAWILDELDTMQDRAADPFVVSEQARCDLRRVLPYWKGKTTSELALSYMRAHTKLAMEHNIFTPGNYLYNGIGHVCVDYGQVLKKGFHGILDDIRKTREQLDPCDGDSVQKGIFLDAAETSCLAAIAYAHRYAVLASEQAAKCTDRNRRQELLDIARVCQRVPEFPAQSFREALQSFWFVQLLIQTESNGHSISPGRFDQYMYPYYRKDIDARLITEEEAQELLDCLWIKFNELSKARDAASAAGFAGYGVFQNLCVGGQTVDAVDATNELSYHCICASMHTHLPQPSLSVRVWNGTPYDLLHACAELTRTGIGLPAYYNDEVIIPALMSRGLTLQDARDYNLIGCVEPQKGGKTDGWHDAAFFNMCRPMELVFSQGMDAGERVGAFSADVTAMRTFEEFRQAYDVQMKLLIADMVDADNAIDLAHVARAPLPFLSTMIDDCIHRGKSAQEGGAVYNFTGPQGFGVANMADAMIAIKHLVFEQKAFSMAELKEALRHNFGKDEKPIGCDETTIDEVVSAVRCELERQGRAVSASTLRDLCRSELQSPQTERYRQIHDLIEQQPRFGNDIAEVDQMARDIARSFTCEVEQYRNPRGGTYQAGLYPVSANVPLGAQTGATPDGRYAWTPIADGVSPVSGRDVKGPTAAANSVARLDHGSASNGTLFNQKFHPSALSGEGGIAAFISLIRAYFDQKGSHVQFNVVSRETLLDAQKNPDNYRTLVVRVAGYSALFTSLSKALQDDIIHRTEQTFGGQNR